MYGEEDGETIEAWKHGLGEFDNEKMTISMTMKIEWSLTRTSKAATNIELRQKLLVPVLQWWSHEGLKELKPSYASGYDMIHTV